MTVTIKDKRTEKEEHYHDFTYFELHERAIIIGNHNNFEVFSREHFEITRIKYNPKWV